LLYSSAELALSVNLSTSRSSNCDTEPQVSVDARDPSGATLREPRYLVARKSLDRQDEEEADVGTARRTELLNAHRDEEALAHVRLVSWRSTPCTQTRGHPP
jgi:hypothetical protein